MNITDLINTLADASEKDWQHLINLVIRGLEHATPEQLTRIFTILRTTQVGFWVGTRPLKLIAGSDLETGQSVWMDGDGKVRPTVVAPEYLPIAYAVRDINKDEVVPWNPQTGELG